MDILYLKYCLIEQEDKTMVRMKIGMDFDDVFAPFNSVAIRLANEKYGLKLTLDDIKDWKNDGKASVIKEFYKDPDLYRQQTLAVSDDNLDAIKRLMVFADVYFISAVGYEFMSTRAMQIKTLLPELPDDRILLGQAKNLVQFDAILDDNIDNVLDSPAEFPVLMRKPWNRNMTGLLSVNSVSEFVSLMEHIERVSREKFQITEPTVIALVGPSGSGKNNVADELLDHFSYWRPKSYTNNPKKDGDCSHVYVPSEEYNTSDYIETTLYAGYYYGCKESEVESKLAAGFNVVLPLDMCGAIGMKRKFPTVIIYVNNDKESIVRNIISSSMDENEKALRILSLEAERKNREICDYVIDNTDGKGASRILSIMEENR